MNLAQIGPKRWRLRITVPSPIKTDYSGKEWTSQPQEWTSLDWTQLCHQIPDYDLFRCEQCGQEFNVQGARFPPFPLESLMQFHWDNKHGPLARSVKRLGLTRSQQMALTHVLMWYMSKPDEPQQFENCSQDPVVITTTQQLLELVNWPPAK